MSVTTNTVRSAEDNLFAEWRDRATDFNPDGVVDEAGYDSAPIKLLFLLKEVNDPGEGFDLRDFLRNGAALENDQAPPTWINIARWVEGIIEVASGRPAQGWDHFHGVGHDLERRKTAFAQIVAVNLKKAAGVGTTRKTELATAAVKDEARLRAQLALYRADFTICCGSAVTAEVQSRQLLNVPRFDKAWKRTNRGIRYHLAGRHGAVIDYSHPAARVAPNLLLYGLLDAVAEIRMVVET